jgi:hypothetical protein
MQPLTEVTLTRPWHWGSAVVGNAVGEVPTDLNGQLVVVGRDVLTLNVRHAQDIEADRFEGDWDWATATIYLRSLVQQEATDREVLCDTIFATPQETLSLGDADGMVVIPAPALRTRLIISTDHVDATGLERVWVDLIPIDD